MKFGRNDPCWCGSGVKFKRCHLGRESELPVQPWEASAKIRKAYSAKLCSAPVAMRAECSGKIVRAHTVPRSGSLAKIAENGHVYAFVPSIENLIKHHGVLPPQLVGINGASTFTGFCSHHDNKLFAPIEQRPFSGAQEQCFLLAYRAHSREVFTKTGAAISANDHGTLDRGRSLVEQKAIQSFASAYGEGIQAAQKDIAYQQPRFEAPLMSGDYTSVRAYVVSFDDPPPVMCSGAFGPEQDFDGQDIQDIADTTVIPQLICVTSFFGGTYGHFVFTWLPEDDPVCVPFVKTLVAISDTELSSALVRLMFESIENIHISPQWWRALTPHHQRALIDRMAASANPFCGRAPGCLKPDGWFVPPWAIRERKWVGIAP